jgi:hypothetical protein
VTRIERDESAAFPSRLTIFGCVSLVAVTPFAIRYVYEETVLTWRYGWQMVGFSVSHLYPGFMLLGIVGIICAHVFLLVWLVRAIVRRIRGQRMSRRSIAIATVVAAVIGLFYVPYAGWMMLMVEIGGPGPNGNSYLSYATALHHPTLAKILINKGVPVDAPYGERTPLNGACVVKDERMARYLISRGAKMNAAPDCQTFNELTGKPKPLQVPGTTIDVHP